MSQIGSAPAPNTPENVAGNHYDKYGSGNPIARKLMAGFFGALDDLVARANPQSAFEVGCGEGHLSLRLAQRGIAVHGMDLDAGVVAEANQASVAAGYGELFKAGSVYDLAPKSISADLLLCCEVLEHVPDPERALDTLAGQDVRHWIFSVPREPIWRALNMARGKYLGALGNTPGHIQHWSRRGFRRMIESRFQIVEMRSPLPWSFALCVARGR